MVKTEGDAALFCGVRLRTEVRTGEVLMEASIRKPPLFTGKYLFYLIVPLMIEQVLAVTIGFADHHGGSRR